MESLGGGRGIIGVLLATGAVAIPIGLVIIDTVAKWLPEISSIIEADLSKVLLIGVFWVLMAVWALGGVREMRST